MAGCFDRESYVVLCSPFDSCYDILWLSDVHSILIHIALIANWVIKATLGFSDVALKGRHHHRSWDVISEIGVAIVGVPQRAFILTNGAVTRFKVRFHISEELPYKGFVEGIPLTLAWPAVIRRSAAVREIF